jgi:60 kDa SS-A/Ro ribonucleoprotein
MAFNTARQKTTKVTHEGGRAFGMSAKHELYTFVCTSMMSGDTFYETDRKRLDRFRRLVGAVAIDQKDTEWLSKLAIYAREQMHLRTTPTILTAELFGCDEEMAMRAADRVWLRGDEHLEAMAYTKVIGAPFTKALLRGVARKLNSMDEYAMNKYAATNKAFSQRDAIRLAHPKPHDEHQSALFKYAVHGWKGLSEEEQNLLDHIRMLKTGGTATWEQHVSKEGSSSESWTEAVNKMGYMALLRNLRNLIEKGVPEEVLERAAERIQNPAAVAKSKQLPFRFLSAWKALPPHAPTCIARAVSQALDHSAMNVPDLEGDTCVLVDESASMTWGTISEKSNLKVSDAARCLGAIMAHRETVGLWAFATRQEWIRVPPGSPVLNIIAMLEATQVSGGTYIGQAIGKALTFKKDYRRIIVCTDMQSMDNAHAVITPWLGEDPSRALYVIDMSGYGKPCVASSVPGVHIVAGFSEKVFDWINAVEHSDPVKLIASYQ